MQSKKNIHIFFYRFPSLQILHYDILAEELWSKTWISRWTKKLTKNLQFILYVNTERRKKTCKMLVICTSLIRKQAIIFIFERSLVDHE